ncbi:MAG: hypothetical protein JSW61_01360 [Candidatus Thorarchaeota archaeon]|nr:MAG: hypothetical protein JSW61_01360 [Candidatus Thorarchaeota archaeon]
MKGSISAKDIVDGKVNFGELQQEYILVVLRMGMTGTHYDELGEALEIMAQNGWRVVTSIMMSILMERSRFDVT